MTAKTGSTTSRRADSDEVAGVPELRCDGSEPVSALGRSAGDLGDELLDGLVGEGDHLGVGPVLDRMGDEESGHVEAEGLGLGFGGRHEGVGGDEHAWDTATLEVGDVVHTARRAASSIGERFDHCVALGRDLVAKVDGCGLGEGRLAIAAYR